MEASNPRLAGYGFYSEQHPAVLSLVQTALGKAKAAGKPAGLVNIAPGNLEFFSTQSALKEAAYLVVRPDVYPMARQLWLEAEGKA